MDLVDIDRRNQVLTSWNDVIDVAPRRGRGIAVVGALKIGEARQLHHELTSIGFKPSGKKRIYNNGEVCYGRYHDRWQQAPVARIAK